jgi:asparagine synthase (glutamine-hydrolysing)
VCGIAGYLGHERPGRLREMVARLVHRGPDDEGFYEEPGVHLGMRRLSIVDLASGGQPKTSADGSVIVLFNGEIYNHVELRTELEAEGVVFESAHSDTEVIAHLFAAHGPAMVERLVGMFAISLYDRRSGDFYLFRDRLGKKPVLYRHDPATGELEYASELPAFALPDRAAHLERSALAWYFSQKTTPGDATADDRVHKLAAGSYLVRRADGRLEQHRYWSIPAATHAVPVEDAVARTEALLADAVRLRMRADVEVGAFLSGGLDSSLCVALASRHSERPLKTYCLVYDHDINHKAEDRRFARLVSERFRTSHHEVLLTPELLVAELPKIVAQYGQPNSAVLSNWFISREMGREIKVALSGDGADELFGSYLLHRIAAALSDLDAGVERSAVLSRLPAGEAALVAEAEPRTLAWLVDRLAVFPAAELVHLLARAADARSVATRLAALEAGLAKTDRLDRALELDCKNLLCEQILHYSDLLSMAHSLEVRTPFLDHRLVEHAFALPSELKIRRGETKWLLRQVARRHLPEELITRPKEGFVEPAVYWIRHQMKAFCRDHLASASFNRLGLLDGAYARAVVDRFYDEQDFAGGKKVWNLLMYALWEKSLGPA